MKHARLLLWALAFAGCGGGMGKVKDAGPQDAGPDQGAPADTAVPDAGPDLGKADAGSDKSTDIPPPPPPESGRLTNVSATLVGAGANSCTNGSEDGDVWCAFAKTSSAIGKHELWVVNVTATLATSAMADCASGTDDKCRKLADDVFMLDQGSMTGGPGVYLHGFTGRTLVYYADATSAAGEHFVGVIKAWRPGWTRGQQLASSGGYLCVPSPSGAWGWCFDNVSRLDAPEAHVEFDFVAGAIKEDGPVFVKQEHVYCCEDATGVKYGAMFSPDDKYFVWSMRAGKDDNETFYYKLTSELGDGAIKTLLFNDGSSRVRFAADGKRFTYLANYDHAAMTPSGDLRINDFPPVGAPTDITDKVAAVGHLGDGKGGARGLLYYRNVVESVGEVWMARDLANPSGKQKLLDAACDVADLAPDKLDRIVYSKTCTASGNDLFAMALDATTGAPTGGECALSTGTAATTFGLPSLTSDGRYLAWVDNVDPTLGIGDFRVTDLPACSTTAWAGAAWAWDPVRSDGFIVNVDSDATRATLWQLGLKKGTVPTPPDPGTCDRPKGCIQKDAHVTYSIPKPAQDLVVFGISAGSTVTDGLWADDKLSW